MITIGSVFFPEASQILSYYCFRDMSDLYVNADYIKNSSVIKNLAEMKIGEKKRWVLDKKRIGDCLLQ